MTIARLSHAAQSTWQERLNRIERITVIALLKRNHEDGSAEYQGRCKVDEWEVPVVEIVYQEALA